MIAKAAAAAGSISMVIFSLKSLFTTLADPDTSGLEKLSTVLMSVSMIVPSTISAFKGISDVFKTIEINSQAAFIAEEKEAAVKAKLIALNEEHNFTIDQENQARQWRSFLEEEHLAYLEAESLETTASIRLDEIEIKLKELQNAKTKEEIELQELLTEEKEILLN